MHLFDEPCRAVTEYIIVSFVMSKLFSHLKSTVSYDEMRKAKETCSMIGHPNTPGEQNEPPVNNTCNYFEVIEFSSLHTTNLNAFLLLP